MEDLYNGIAHTRSSVKYIYDRKEGGVGEVRQIEKGSGVREIFPPASLYDITTAMNFTYILILKSNEYVI